MAKIIGNTTEVINTINNVNVKENKTMKTNKDYTLNGAINATTWQEFRTVMKEAGINTGTKSYHELVEEYNKLPKDNVISVGDMSSDRYSEIETVEQTTVKENDNKPEVITKLQNDFVNKLILELHSRRRKFDSRGLIDVSDAYKAVCQVFDRPSVSKIKGVLNFMVRCGYITFKNDRGLQLFLTFSDVVKDENNNVIGVRK